MELTDQPLQPFGRTLIDTAIPSDLLRKTSLVREMVTALQAHHCLPSSRTARAELVLDEAVTNAIVHGNRGDPTKNVRVRLFADGTRWGAIIEDEGTGFDPAAVLQKLVGTSLLRDGGRGLLLMDEYLDEFTYADEGRAVMLVRHCTAEPSQEPAAAGVAAAGAPAVVGAGAKVVSMRMEGEVAVAEILQDSLFGDNSETVLAALAQAVRASATVAVDMHRVRYVSSVGLAVIAQTYKLMQERGGVIVLAGVQDEIREFLARSRLADFFRFAPDLPAAVRLAERASHY